MLKRLSVAAPVFALSVFGTCAAHAYMLESIVGDPCHERLTADALASVRSLLSTAPVIEPTDDERALIDDLPFTLGDSALDLAAASLLIGVRDNDLKGRRANELDSLATVHGNPDAQREHCLRRADEDEPGGSEAAVADCRAFVAERFDAALAGLGADGMPDAGSRVDIDVALAVRGSVTASLPAFYVRMGQAMHAVQDSYSHTYRTPDGSKITVVLNWIDDVNKQLDEGRDGPPHTMEMDRCDDPDELRAQRHAQAEHASVEMLRVALDPALAMDGKVSGLNALLDETLSFQPGCTMENNWCDAPEHQLPAATGCGCRVAGGSGEGTGTAAAPGVAALALLLGWTRRRRARRRSAAGPTLALVAGSTLVLGAASALADAPPEAARPVVVPPGAVPDKPKAIPDPAEPWRSALGVAPSASAAIDNPAFAATLGVRYRFAQRWVAGLDGEWNPFLATNGTTVRSGVFNGYATLIRRWPLRFEAVNLRTTVNAGVSVLLMDLYGAPAGSVGPYFGVAPLGIEWKLRRSFYLTADPLHLAVPIPHLSGVPFAYAQYRTTLGAEFDIL